MRVITAADRKFASIKDFWKEQVESVGLANHYYQLEDLSLNLPGNETFVSNGYYVELGEGKYKSRGVHKPFVVKQAIRDFDEDLLYLDADAFLRGQPNLMAGDWDVCVTVRPTTEQNRTSEDKRSWIGVLNAGVIWFNNTHQSRQFVDEWADRTLEEMNDQRALNLMCQAVQVGKVATCTLRNGTSVRIMGVPTEIYNNYYMQGVEKAAVVHLKQNEWQNLSRDQLLKRIQKLRLDEDSDFIYFEEDGIDLLDYYDSYITSYALWEMMDALIDENPEIIDEEATEEMNYDQNQDNNQENSGPIDDPTPVSYNGS